jgi:hypothetical protein
MFGISKLKVGDKLLFTGYKWERDDKSGYTIHHYNWCDAINKRLTIGKEYPIEYVNYDDDEYWDEELEQFRYENRVFYVVFDNENNDIELNGNTDGIDIGFDRAWVPANISEDAFIKAILLHGSEEALVAWKSRFTT